MTGRADGPIRMRLFFALWPDPPIRRALGRVARRRAGAARGRPVPLSNLHLTLAFLGSVGAGELEGINSAAASISTSPFELVLDRVGFFHRANSLWFGSSGACPELIALEQALWEVLEATGRCRERRPFMPHVTLVRKASPISGQDLAKAVNWPVGHFSLIQSVTEQQGARYTQLQRWPLRAG